MNRYRGPVLSDDSTRPPKSLVLSPYSHVSTYRSTEMELQLHSPSVKYSRAPAGNEVLLAVFSDRDQVKGKVTLSHSCYHTGRLSLSIEGAFVYSPMQVGKNDAAGHPEKTGKRKHVFFSSSTVLHVSPGSGFTPPRFPFRHAFMKRQPSISSLNLNDTPTERSFPFSFELPGGYRVGEEMPPSFTGSLEPELSLKLFDVIYKFKILWEARNHADHPRTFEIPILFRPATDFQSRDTASDRQSWLEMPLTSDRPVPFQCAVTLPASVTFTRTSSIPYFAIFKTIPRSADLAKEIASDATISVSLLRQVVVIEGASPPPSRSHVPTSEPVHDDFNSPPTLKNGSRSDRSVKPARYLDDNLGYADKSLPRLPMHTIFSESHTVQNGICIGFPKRPRCQTRDPGGHPSLDSQVSLPDGLHKAEIQLYEGMLPSIDWAGISVKYYIDISVLVGQDHLRARIPIRIV